MCLLYKTEYMPSVAIFSVYVTGYMPCVVTQVSLAMKDFDANQHFHPVFKTDLQLQLTAFKP